VGRHVLAHTRKTGDLADAREDEIQTQQATPGEKSGSLRIYNIVVHVLILLWFL
jgi:hypothetical protein